MYCLKGLDAPPRRFVVRGINPPPNQREAERRAGAYLARQVRCSIPRDNAKFGVAQREPAKGLPSRSRILIANALDPVARKENMVEPELAQTLRDERETVGRGACQDVRCDIDKDISHA